MLIDYEDFISGDKIIDLSDHKYNVLNNYQSTNLPTNNDIKVIYCHTEFVNRFFQEIYQNTPFVLLSHNGDGKITDKPNQYDASIHNMPSNLLHWFGANVQVQHTKITSLPTGLENRCWFPEVNKQQQIFNLTQKEKKITNLCYMNFNTQTNPSERLYIFNRFKHEPWITCDMRQNGCDFIHYINMIYNHKFVLCPEGNQNGHVVPGGAIGSHRFWECLYAKTIPIITKGLQADHFLDLPVLFVESWNDINESFLNKQYDIIINKKYNMFKLQLSYWKQQIKIKKCNI